MSTIVPTYGRLPPEDQVVEDQLVEALRRDTGNQDLVLVLHQKQSLEEEEERWGSPFLILNECPPDRYIEEEHSYYWYLAWRSPARDGTCRMLFPLDGREGLEKEIGPSRYKEIVTILRSPVGVQLLARQGKDRARRQRKDAVERQLRIKDIVGFFRRRIHREHGEVAAEIYALSTGLSRLGTEVRG